MIENIILDAGHGNRDKGCSYGGYNEKDIALSIVKNIAVRLHKPFLLTRYTDVFVSLKERCRIANENSPKIFVSVHCNAAPNLSAKGVEVWYYNHLGISKQLAELFVNRLSLWSSRNRGIKKAYVDNKGIYVLKHTTCPAILIEVGFLSSSEDREKLIDPFYQKVISCEIAKLLDIV